MPGPYIYPQEIFDTAQIVAFGLHSFTQAASSLYVAGTTPANQTQKSAWIVLFANAPFAVLAFYFSFNAANQGNFQVDIGIGPGGSETVLLPDFSWVLGPAGFTLGIGPLYFPIALGTRIVYRAANEASGVNLNFGANLILFG